MEFERPFDLPVNAGMDATSIFTRAEMLGGQLHGFSWVDYMVMFLVLAASLAIGIYFGCFGTKQSTDSEYLRGDKKMATAPVAISLIGGYISGITLLGTPSDIYTYGTQYYLVALGIIGMAISVNYLFLPVFFNLNVTSSYEYLEIRFKHISVRALSSVIFILDEFVTVPLYMYVPCVALEGVTELSRTYVAPVVMLICIAYTSLGGLKAVIWTDALQIAMFFGSLVILFVIGTVRIGGFAPVFEAASRGGRVIFDDFDPDPLVRMTFWGSVFGGYMYWTGFNSVNQTCVQRYISVPTLRSARLTVWWFMAGCLFVISFCVYIGLLAYAFYEGCDPYKQKKIQSAQLIPILVSDLEGEYFGLPGLFMAGVFSAALSSIATSVNSTGGVLLDDFYRGIMKRPLDDRKASIFAKIASVIFGFLCVGIMMAIHTLDSIIEISMSLTGIACGSQFGIFSLGMMNPWATYQGTLTGGITSVAIMCWISLGSAMSAQNGLINYPKLPTSVDKCPEPIPTLAPAPTMSPTVFPVYKLSFMWTAFLGWIIVMIVGSLVSLFWGKRHTLDDAEPSHFLPPIASYLERRKAKKASQGTTNGVPMSNASAKSTETSLAISHPKSKITGDTENTTKAK